MLVALLKFIFYAALIVAGCMLSVVLARGLFYILSASFFSLVFAARTRTEENLSFWQRFRVGLIQYACVHPMPELLNVFVGPLF